MKYSNKLTNAGTVKFPVVNRALQDNFRKGRNYETHKFLSKGKLNYQSSFDVTTAKVEEVPYIP
jgi:hypothetical protein